MGKIRTLNEIQLKKENLRYKLNHAEKRMLHNSESLVVTFGHNIISPVLEKGLKTVLDYFLKGRKKKKETAEE